MKGRNFEFEINSNSPINILRKGQVSTSRSFAIRENAVEDRILSAPVTTLVLKRQDPPMQLVDELIFLLHTASEIEHSLMIQYLYSAYSLPNFGVYVSWRNTLISIAREEMGHLMAVQNMLLALGGPVNFEREDFPFNILYPFSFQLEPLSVHTVAKYVLAEMPTEDEIPVSLGFDLNVVQHDAKVNGENIEVQRVGALYKLLLDLTNQLDEINIHTDSESFQADPREWQAGIYKLILQKVKNINGIEGLIPLIAGISEQGEGARESPINGPSHFLRFFELYKSVKEYSLTHGEVSLSKAVPINPTVYNKEAPGYLSNPQSKAWGDVFNHRFRWLLSCINHHLISSNSQDRNILKRWAFSEMGFLSGIAKVLSNLPQHHPTQVDEFGRPRMAGSPFELPYSLNLPNRNVDAWRYHKRMAEHTLQQLAQNQDKIAKELVTNDQDRIQFIEQILKKII